MFNALNRFISRLDGEAPRDKDQGRSLGFQVLRNENLELPIEPWFDFVVGINGRMIDDSEPRLFAQEVRNCAGGSVMLGLWSAKGQRTRAIHVHVPPDSASLGLTLQWTPLAAATNVWHVLDVPAGSPADAAGLLPYSDYVLGSPEGALHGEPALGELVEDHIGRPLRLWVYNNEYDVTREVAITPSRDWGGEGALGCVLGFGALHRLPAPLSEPVSGPGETMFDGDAEKRAASGFEQAVPTPPPPPGGDGPHLFVPAAEASPSADFIVPAQMAGAAGAAGAGAAPPPAGGAPPRGKKKERHAQPKSAMDDYFNEQEKKSRELDNAPAGRRTPVAPPPKAGGPPKGPPRAETPGEAEG